jgi:Domain of unknown function (DUF4388)/FHA domain
MEKILEGSLAGFEVPDLLAFLGQGGRTGVLVLERPDTETKLFFREGRVVYASSTHEMLRFGATLVRLGKVSAPVLDRALQKYRGARIGQALLSEKLVSEEELAAFLKVHVSEVIFHTFPWGDGLFTFYDQVPPPATAVTLDMDLVNLVLEGVRRQDPGDALNELLGDRDRVVEAHANPERVKQDASLTREEWRIFFLVDGRRTIHEICQLVAGAEGTATLQILYRLLRARLVGLAPHPPDRKASVAREAAGTQKMPELKAEAPPSVEFSHALPLRKAEDDTHEIVNKKAQQYLANASRLTVSRLILVAPDGNETSSFPLIRDSYTLGRHRNNDIVITDAKVSSFHGRIDRNPDGFHIVDLKSRNGCWVNGKRTEDALLKTGDEIRVGAAKLVYKVDHTSAVGVS